MPGKLTENTSLGVSSFCEDVSSLFTLQTGVSWLQVPWLLGEGYSALTAPL